MSQCHFHVTRSIAVTCLLVGLSTVQSSAQNPLSGTPLGRITSSASAEMTTANPIKGDDLDVVFIDSSRVLFIRLHLQINGLSFREAWEQTTDKFYDYADLNRDGTLTLSEARAGLRVLGTQPSLSDMDSAPKDEKISRKEWTAALARYATPQFTTGTSGQTLAITGNGVVVRGGAGGNSGSALWKLLDTDQDSVLTTDELTAAPKVLAKFDGDDDQIIQAAELEPYSNPNARAFVAQSGEPERSRDYPTVLIIPGDGDLTKLADDVIKKQDGRDKSKKDQQLSLAELPIGKEQFAVVDRNKDGQLDQAEVAALLKDTKPQLALIVRQGPEAARRGKFALATVNDKPAMLAAAISGSPRATVTLQLDRLRLDFTAADGGGRWVGNYEEVYKRQFQAYDRDGNEYLDKKEVANIFGGNTFEEIDRDGNGMVFLKEFAEYYRLRDEASQARLTLQGQDQGKLLFDQVDANRDGRLSQRELAEMAGKLPQWDRNGDGKLEESEITRQFTFSIGRGNTNGVRDAPVALARGASPRAPQATAPGAPAWFLKMDRNGDGDLSRREFLGTAEAFDKLDANHDGLIDLKEAAAAQQAAAK